MSSIQRLTPIANLAGVGDLYRYDEHLGQVSYQVCIWREMISDEHGGEMPGSGDITGRLLESGEIDLFKLMDESAHITLHFEDGRRWDCWLKNTRGELAHRRGDIYTP